MIKIFLVFILTFSHNVFSYDYESLLNNPSFTDALMCKVILQNNKGDAYNNAEFKVIDIVIKDLLKTNERLDSDKVNNVIEIYHNQFFNTLVEYSNGSVIKLQNGIGKLKYNCENEFKNDKKK